MITVYTIKFLLSIITFLSIVLISFQLFRIPIDHHYKSIGLTGVILGSLGFYLNNILKSELTPVVILVFFTLLIFIIHRYPFFYCLLISVFGTIVGFFVDFVISITSLKLNLTTLEQMKTSLLHSILLHLATFLTYFLIFIFLNKTKIGFFFLAKRFYRMDYLKSYNFLFAALLLVAVITTQIVMHFVKFPSIDQLIIVLGIMSIAMLLALWYAYKDNKKFIRERYQKNNDFPRQKN